MGGKICNPLCERNRCFTSSANNHNFVIKNVIETLKGNQEKDATPEECLEVIAFIEEVYKTKNVESIVI